MKTNKLVSRTAAKEISLNARQHSKLIPLPLRPYRKRRNRHKLRARVKNAINDGKLTAVLPNPVLLV